MASSADSNATPLLFFLAGALVPSLAWFFLRPKNEEYSAAKEEDEDEDTADAPTGGPASTWGYTDAPNCLLLFIFQI